MENNSSNEILKIDETFATPKVEFDTRTGLFRITGNSYPEDPVSFYGPIIEWLKNYAKNPNEATLLQANFKYFNTPSIQIFLEIFNVFEDIYQHGKKAGVEWIYNPNNEELKENGETYAAMYTMPFRLTEESPDNIL